MFGALCAAFAHTTDAGAQQPTPPAVTGFGTIQGTVIDSIHRVPLAGAALLIDGVVRMGFTGSDGRYTIDSLPPGSYRVHLSHPLLDTIGLVIATQPLVVRPSEAVTLDLGVPSSDHIVSVLCPDPMLARGPGALIGQVVDPETDRPASGSKVQFVYEETGPFGAKAAPTIRETTVDSVGSYRICGLPRGIQGKLQVLRGGVSSGQVDMRLENGLLGLRSLSVVSTRAVATVVDSAGKSRQITIGNARLTGKIVNKSGTPVQSARISLFGAGTATLTNARGEFSLDSLPLGTQSLEVRKLGYGPTDKPIELSASSLNSVTVVMADYALPAVRIEADREKALADNGYLERKAKGNGYFFDGPKIRPEEKHFSDVMRQAPILKVVPAAHGKYTITSARDPNSGCVKYVLDGVAWKEMEPGDIDDFLQPAEIRAIEVYGPATVPGRFQVGASTGCITVVIWTVRGTDRARKK
jgi:hypothetical protein